MYILYPPIINSLSFYSTICPSKVCAEVRWCFLVLKLPKYTLSTFASRCIQYPLNPASMPTKTKHLCTHAENFFKGVKRAIVSLSPRKKRKVLKEDEVEKENLTVRVHHHPSRFTCPKIPHNAGKGFYHAL